ncbi:dipeptide ABC transporter ATP-binding protein [Notoacmeibacter ruber]|uniref:ABC transporter ATP-binding protein n=1 Tax=Notoacmeibacter ruber TaxID=2670375 RepID=A0A3L7JCS5_9HYPH|nr:ABC transporter ATP-binding protein [Notoacmeibacter ruber]RLQ87371.1 ABC transporter ATP-binding protein [Notoacmeibacter ruber]
MLLEIENLNVRYPSRRGEFVALKDVSLSLERGEILGLVGESGAGKSTVGSAVIGLLPKPGFVDSGRIVLAGEQLVGRAEAELEQLRGARMGMIFQDPMTSLNPLETVGWQLSETIMLHKRCSRREAAATAVGLMESVGIRDPGQRFGHYPHQFSGGMRQRVVIALAICGDPDVIVADEPTTALDVSVQSTILELLKKICRERGVGMILVTHDMGVIAEVADRVAVMYRGEVVEVGDTHDILTNPRHRYTQSLISAVPRSDVKIPRFPLVSYIEDAGEPDISRLRERWTGSDDKRESVALSVRDLSVDFVVGRSWTGRPTIKFRAVNGASFEIPRGQTLGIVGESGSGKSTIARTLAGIYAPSGGEIIFNGQSLTKVDASVAKRRRRDLQMIFQDPYSSLNGRMRVQDIIAEPILFQKGRRYHKEAMSTASDLLEIVGLGSAAGRKFAHEFSGGQRQRISIARALATGANFIICDEPTSALDVSIQAQLLNLIKDLQEELDLTLLFISHDLPVIRQMCDQVCVMRKGVIVEQAETEQLFEFPEHEYSKLLLSLVPSLFG